MSHCHTLIASLRQRGHRITPQREMIIEALAHSGGHVTADNVFAQVRDRTNVVNIATVYRTLDLLVASGSPAESTYGMDAWFTPLFSTARTSTWSAGAVATSSTQTTSW